MQAHTHTTLTGSPQQATPSPKGEAGSELWWNTLSKKSTKFGFTLDLKLYLHFCDGASVLPFQWHSRGNRDRAGLRGSCQYGTRISACPITLVPLPPLTLHIGHSRPLPREGERGSARRGSGPPSRVGIRPSRCPVELLAVALHHMCSALKYTMQGRRKGEEALVAELRRREAHRRVEGWKGPASSGMQLGVSSAVRVGKKAGL